MYLRFLINAGEIYSDKNLVELFWQPFFGKQLKILARDPETQNRPIRRDGVPPSPRQAPPADREGSVVKARARKPAKGRPQHPKSFTVKKVSE